MLFLCKKDKARCQIRALPPGGAGAENEPLNWKEQFVVQPVGVSSICVFTDYQFS